MNFAPPLMTLRPGEGPPHIRLDRRGGVFAGRPVVMMRLRPALPQDATDCAAILSDLGCRNALVSEPPQPGGGRRLCFAQDRRWRRECGRRGRNHRRISRAGWRLHRLPLRRCDRAWARSGQSVARPRQASLAGWVQALDVSDEHRRAAVLCGARAWSRSNSPTGPTTTKSCRMWNLPGQAPRRST